MGSVLSVDLRQRVCPEEDVDADVDVDADADLVGADTDPKVNVGVRVGAVGVCTVCAGRPVELEAVGVVRAGVGWGRSAAA